MAIEGNDGFAQVFSGKKLTAVVSHFGSPWDLLQPGLVFKRYPCCSGAHPALDCIFDLLAEEPFSAEEVASIQVGVSLLGPQELCVHTPKVAIEGKFSMEYALAAAIVYREVGLPQFTDSAVQDPRIQALIPKIKMEVDPELAALGFIGTAPAKIEVRLKNGNLFQRRCDLAKGNPEKPLSDSDLQAKFLNCAATLYPTDKARSALETVLGLEAAPDIQKITQTLGAGPKN
jgi:2-methylcitrate dehydratase PrpD